MIAPKDADHARAAQNTVNRNRCRQPHCLLVDDWARRAFLRRDFDKPAASANTAAASAALPPVNLLRPFDPVPSPKPKPKLYDTLAMGSRSCRPASTGCPTRHPPSHRLAVVHAGKHFSDVIVFLNLCSFHSF